MEGVICADTHAPHIDLTHASVCVPLLQMEPPE